MTIRLIAYDLNSPGQNHAKVLERIKAYPSWAYISESAYAVETTDHPETIFEHFSPLLDPNDTFLVLTLTGPWTGRANKKVIDWLQQLL